MPAVQSVSSYLVIAVIVSVLPALAQDCADCHSGQDKKAATVSLAPNSAHGKLECQECHTGVKQPCQKNMKVTQCKTCHNDQAVALNGSTHLAKLKECLSKSGEATPTTVCLSCHGGDVHTLRLIKDPSSPNSRAHVSATCLTCHDKGQHIAVSKYSESVHGKAMANGKTKAAECADCHGSHAIDGSQRSTSKVAHTTIPATCGQCHPEERAQYEASAHWDSVKRGFREPPVCTDCHGEHTIGSSQDKTSATWAGNVTKTCAACHGSEKIAAKFGMPSDRVSSFKDSYHGLTGQLGDTRAANCASCHGNHMILPSSDSRSTVYPDNLGKTCGNCHAAAQLRFTTEKVHTSDKTPSHWSVAVVRFIYICLIVLTIGGMLGHNLLDLFYKATRGLPYHKKEILTPRFSVAERIQHAMLALSFISLAITGFALRFPESPFAWLFPMGNSGADARHWLHRAAAFLFMALSVCHFLYLLGTTRGRTQLKALWPRFQDALDVKKVLTKYLHLSHEQLQLPHYGYVEKAEYWALVWGGGVMTVTGLVLLFVNLSMSNLPLWVVELARTIHFWEALLAVLAIIVWHGYWVALDPEYYPLNLTWLIGRPRPLSSEACFHEGKSENTETAVKPADAPK